MLALENKILVRRFLDALNQAWTEAIQEYVADDGLLNIIMMLQIAFPNFQITADEMIAENRKVTVRATLRGVHRGEFKGVQPSHNNVVLPFMAICQVAGGKIVGHTLMVDRMMLMRQLEESSVGETADSQNVRVSGESG